MHRSGALPRVPFSHADHPDSGKSKVVFVCGLMVVFAMSAGGSWLMSAGDGARDGWAREETTLRPDNVARLKLKWKLRLDSQARELTSLSAPLVASAVPLRDAVRDLVVVAGATDTLDVVDAAEGRVLWHREFVRSAAPSRQASWMCPNALNATPAIDLEGRPVVRVLASDGRLHSVNLATGDESQPALAFVPPFAKAWSLAVHDGRVFTAVSGECGGAKSGVYAMNMQGAEQAPQAFQAAPAGAGIWGSAGVAISNGTIFAATGDGEFDPDRGSFANSVVALNARTLQIVDYFTPANWETLASKDLDIGSTTPVVFPFHGREIVAVAGKDGRIFLLDAKSLGGVTHQIPLFETPVMVNAEEFPDGRGFWGAFASWEDPGGVRYLAVPAWGALSQAAGIFPRANGEATHGAVMAFRVEQRGKRPTLTPAWMSRDMNVPSPPVVANGVLFAVSTGEQAMQMDRAGRQLNSQDRIRTAPGHAVLYALNAATGRELFNSGNSIRAFMHMTGLAVSSGQVYVTTFDSMLYCFGLR